jgi:hypothetical protein
LIYKEEGLILKETERQLVLQSAHAHTQEMIMLKSGRTAILQMRPQS